MRHWRPGDHGLTLFDVLARFRDQRSTDPRDKIYGILGLVSEEHALKVQYQKTEAEVFAAATAELIRLRQDFDIICQNPWELPASLQSFRRRLPCWVSDFGNRIPVLSDGNESRNREFMFAQRQIFSASSSTCESRWEFWTVSFCSFMATCSIKFMPKSSHIPLGLVRPTIVDFYTGRVGLVRRKSMRPLENQYFKLSRGHRSQTVRPSQLVV